jgi:hypothetical protein
MVMVVGELLAIEVGKLGRVIFFAALTLAGRCLRWRGEDYEGAAGAVVADCRIGGAD